MNDARRIVLTVRVNFEPYMGSSKNCPRKSLKKKSEKLSKKSLFYLNILGIYPLGSLRGIGVLPQPRPITPYVHACFEPKNYYLLVFCFSH
jgi:hypothetical protein